jgi:thiamine biosynthesis lipoprotein
MRFSFRPTFSFILVLVTLLLVGCSQPEPNGAQELLMSGRTMGTTYHIKFVADYDEQAQQALQQQIDLLLQQINQQMSTYIPDSELSQFNELQSTSPVQISDGLRDVIAESIRLGQLSNGLLDITVGPLVNLWGFGPTHRPDVVPTEAELQQTKAKTGLKYLKLQGNQLQKLIPELYVDLSTTAKGYGVDKVAGLLESRNIHQYLVEIGGEMRVKGKKLNGQPWRIAIEKPVTSGRAIQQIITPFDHAVATSGDYRNYFEENGERFSHIIDPTTGKPIHHKLVSVTVIDDSCMTADGLATMFMVMGTEKALAFASAHDMAILTITKTEDGFKQQTTVKFNQFLAE